MRPFSYVRAHDDSHASNALLENPEIAQFIAGGTTMIDLMKLDVFSPSKLIDISKLGLNEIRKQGDGVYIGALATNTDTAHHPLIETNYPVLSQAILSGASVQLRNMATVGGNILQKTRCPYFRDTSMPCNKREPGSGCPAINGYSRMHAIFGTSDQCIAANPSDMCVALVALDAQIHITGREGQRTVPISQFYLLPGDHPEKENVLKAGEIITGVELPGSRSSLNSHYIKVRDRHSFSFALVSVAACFDMDGSTVREARLALGGVGTMPWRLRDVETMLKGQSLTADSIEKAAHLAVAEAKPQKHNKFKVQLTKRAVKRALDMIAGKV